MLTRAACARELVNVTIPYARDESILDLSRTREDAVAARPKARQQLKALLFRDVATVARVPGRRRTNAISLRSALSVRHRTSLARSSEREPGFSRISGALHYSPGRARNICKISAMTDAVVGNRPAPRPCSRFNCPRVERISSRFSSAWQLARKSSGDNCCRLT